MKIDILLVPGYVALSGLDRHKRQHRATALCSYISAFQALKHRHNEIFYLHRKYEFLLTPYPIPHTPYPKKFHLDPVKQITFDFGAAETPPAEPDLEPVVETAAEPVLHVPKKRGRKPKDPTTIIKKIPGKRGRKSLKDDDAMADLTDIPEDEQLFRKQYYSMSEVTDMFRVNHSLIRLWENEFDILKPKKNKKGDRLFRPEDVKNLQLIHHLLRQRKYTMEGAKEYLKKNTVTDRKFVMLQTLQKLRTLLLEIKASL